MAHPMGFEVLNDCREGRQLFGVVAMMTVSSAPVWRYWPSEQCVDSQRHMPSYSIMPMASAWLPKRRGGFMICSGGGEFCCDHLGNEVCRPVEARPRRC